jgi:hypothetical protein
MYTIGKVFNSVQSKNGAPFMLAVIINFGKTLLSGVALRKL